MVNTKVITLWDILPCSLVDMQQHYRDTCCL